MRHLLPLLLAPLLLAAPALAQHHARGSHAPYAGQQQRAVKALSAEQIADLEAGRGMGLALAAELNGYPGPSHVLELAEGLELTAEQHAATEAVFAAMQSAAIRSGRAVIAAEAALDRLFAAEATTPEALGAAVAEAGVRHAELRRVHLEAHLDMVRILTPAQRRDYARLRGYAR
jgi:Spy/CpxP family protein refolding chaperone